MVEARRRACCVEWGFAGRPFPGERASGDRCTVVPWGDGVLVAVIDALGHGRAAASTARRASAVLERHAQEPLPALIERCHAALLGDRGAVMGAASIDGKRRRLTWAGVGNVTGLLLSWADGPGRRRERLVAPAGIVGGRLPALKAASVSLAAGDLVMLATDGVREGFADGLVPSCESCQRLAERLILAHATAADDALILIVRYLGGS
jgi:negative regulator of sigma-B (phosphoserine phosphatase)